MTDLIAYSVIALAYAFLCECQIYNVVSYGTVQIFPATSLQSTSPIHLFLLAFPEPTSSKAYNQARWIV